MRGKQTRHTVEAGTTGYAGPERRSAATAATVATAAKPRGKERSRLAEDGAPDERAPAHVRALVAAQAAEQIATMDELDGRHSARQLAAREKWRRCGVTERELEVWELAAMGMNRTSIGQTLHITLATVRKHFENLYTKVGVHSGQRLVAMTWSQGLVERGDVD